MITVIIMKITAIRLKSVLKKNHLSLSLNAQKFQNSHIRERLYHLFILNNL